MKLPFPLHGLAAAWHDKGFYAEAALRRRGAGLLYLLAVVAALQAAAFLPLAITFDAWAIRQGPAYAAQFPHLTIDHGWLSSDAPLPCSIVEPKTRQVIATIDPEADLAHLPPGSPPVVATRTQVALRRTAYETRVIDLARVRHFEFGPAQVLGLLRALALVGTPLAYVLFVGGTWVWNAFVALVLAAFALLLARRQGPRLDYAACLRVAVVALTPVLILDTLMHLMGFRLPWWALVSLLLGAGYVYFGLSALRGEAGAAPAEPTGPPAAPQPPPADPGTVGPA